MLDGQYNFRDEEEKLLNDQNNNKIFDFLYEPIDGSILDLKEILSKNRDDIWILVCPPPNAYDRPHMGNLSGYVYMDALARFNRMLGKRVIMLPGKDHAGLEGEAVFVRDQLTPNGKKKSDYSRNEFYNAIFNQQQEFIKYIQNDEKRIGLSADFSRDLYTLDPKVVNKVLETFIEAFEKGLIYKGERLVNWDIAAQSTISDSQCEREERDGKLYFLKYGLEPNSNQIKPEMLQSLSDLDRERIQEFIEIATSRPETIFADTAIAVNPDDPRYLHLIGKKVQIPLTDRWIPIITSKRVEKDFGTGALKITPSHAQDDFVIMEEWNRDNPNNKIGYVNCIGKLGEMVGPVPSQYIGKKAKLVKDEIEIELREKGLLEKTEPIKQNLLISERTKAIVEPMIASSWFMKVDNIKSELKNLVNSGELVLHPKDAENRLFAWIDNLKDWSISRTLWWGYRLPVWYKGKLREGIDNNGQVFSEISIDNNWVKLDLNNSDQVKIQIDSPGDGWIQDEEVLDTWFSSGQWPYLQMATWGLMELYPIDTLVSGSDLLIKWDLIMIIMSYLKFGKTPFKNLYLTGLVLGKDGQKMSKSKKNGIPIDEIIEKYGVDSFRMNCIFRNAPMTNYMISDNTLKGFRNFNNKIWNAAKFVINQGIELEAVKSDISEDIQFIDSLNSLQKTFIENMKKYKLGIASESIYLSFWNDYCDKFIEDSKSIIGKFENGEYHKFETEIAKMKRSTLTIALVQYLKMLHPFVPFVTQRIWNELYELNLVKEKYLMFSQYV